MTAHGTFQEYVSQHPNTAALLQAVREAVATAGPAEERVSKSQIVFIRRNNVVTAWAPGQYGTSNPAPLVLTFDFPARDRSSRWKEVVEPHPGHVTHHLELWSIDDLDEDVAGWIRTAWDAAA